MQPTERERPAREPERWRAENQRVAHRNLGKSNVWCREHTQVAWEAAQETAGGSPKGEMSGSERVN